MAKKRYINTRFWDDQYVSNLDPTEKLLFLYFLTNQRTDICGIYEIPLKSIAVDTGIDKEMVVKIINRFTKDKKIFYILGWVFIKNFTKHQAVNPKIEEGIKRSLSEVPNNVLAKIREIQGIKDSLSIDYDSLSIDSELLNLNLNLNSNLIATEVAWNFNENLNMWLNGKDRRFSLIAKYFKFRGISFKTKEQMTVAGKRHLRSATDLVAFSDEQIEQAISKIQDSPEMAKIFTLETIIKYLTK
jgi:hypothetical protein